MRTGRTEKLLLALAAAALFYAGMCDLVMQNERAKRKVTAAQLDHVHRHLVAGCTIVDGGDTNGCEAQWLIVLEK